MGTVMIIGYIICVIQRFYKAIEGKERHVYEIYVLKLPMQWTRNQGVDHLAAGFYKRKLSWKCHTERFPEVVNGETVYVKWLKMFCTVRIVFCASEAGINQKQTASLVSGAQSRNLFRGALNVEVNWIWGIPHLPHGPRSVCLGVQLKKPNLLGVCRTEASAWALVRGTGWADSRPSDLTLLRDMASQPCYYSASLHHLSNHRQ